MTMQVANPSSYVESCFAGVMSGIDLMGRRSQAAFRYWTALPNVRDPSELAALQSAYWRQALADYRNAWSRVMPEERVIPRDEETSTARRADAPRARTHA